MFRATCPKHARSQQFEAKDQVVTAGSRLANPGPALLQNPNLSCKHKTACPDPRLSCPAFEDHAEPSASSVPGTLPEGHGMSGQCVQTPETLKTKYNMSTVYNLFVCFRTKLEFF